MRFPSASQAHVAAAALCLALLGAATAVAAALPARSTATPLAVRPLADGDAARFAAACGSANPYVAMAVLGRAADPGADAGLPAVVAARHGGRATGEAPVVLATRGEVGDVYGLGYDATRGHLYAAAYMRAGGAFGPGGPGAVYRIDLASGAVTTVAQVPAGDDPHGSADAADRVGKGSLGDLEVAPDGDEAFVTNMLDGHIYRLMLPDGRVRDHFAHGDSREAWSEDARPMGLAIRGTWVYHGVVNTRETAGTMGLFEARLFRATPGLRDTYRILRVGLDYPRTFGGPPWSTWRPGAPAASVDQPILADVAFRPDGAPILGLRDRQVDVDGRCVWDPACRPAGPSVGDILPARLSVDGQLWEVVRQPPWYQDSDAGNLEVTFGAMASVPGLDVIVAPGRSLTDKVEDGASVQVHLHWLSNATGTVLRSEPVLGPQAPDGTPILDLAPGDVEALCPPRDDVDPALAATGTAEAHAAATERASREAVARATTHSQTQTAAAPIRAARQTAAAATATALVPTFEAEAPTASAAAATAAGLATALAPHLTALAPTERAVATRRARVGTPPPETATAAAAVYAEMDGSCGTHNPYLVTARFVPRLDGNGVPYGSSWRMDQPAVVAFNDTDPPDVGRHHTLAVEPQVGAVYGVAADLARDQIYVSAYVKRLAELGPLGPGGIYQIDLPTGVVRPWAVLPGGSDPHRMRDEFDRPASSAVGRVGIGDIEVSESADELYAVSLSERLVYRLSVPDGRVLGAFPHGAAGWWWAKDAVPFALAVRGGWLYHGVIDTQAGAGPGRPDPGRPQRAYVFRSRPDGSDMAEVSRLDMAYGRSPSWQPWLAGAAGTETRHEPILADIEFRLDGDLVLGIRDRGGDTQILRAGSGDIVLTMSVDGGRRFIPLTIPEVYQDNIRHAEASWGSLAALPWLDETVSTLVDPERIYSGGVGWFENAGGGWTRLEEIYAGANQTFGKAAGLGDIEALCVALTPTPSSTPEDTPTPRRTDTPGATLTPSATLTPTTSPTVGATVTPSRTPTATPTVYTIYLPESRRDQKCIPDAFHTDVVLVLDRSTSMLRTVEEGGLPKNEAAIAAAKDFVALLDFSPDALGRHDQVAVVGFNDTAWTELDLTNDRAAALDALERIRHKTIEGTRLDLALYEGQKPLDGPRRMPANRPVIILLTDGLPNRVPTPAPIGPQEATVARAAAAAKAKGTRVYTIGLGKPTDINPRSLIECASERGLYYYAPRPEALAGIYAQIAHTFETCDPYVYVTPTPCIPEESLVDVVLVLDMSTSMYRGTGTGRTKHQAAVAAAKAFVDTMDFEPDGWGQHDQVAVVGFNDDAWTALALSRDRAAIDRALDGLMARIREGTRLDLAFHEARRAAEGPGRLTENQPVIVFLTDGLPNRVPTPAPIGPQEETVRLAAQAAKDRGIRIFTIGLGEEDDVLRPLLELCASEPSMYYYAPDGDDLERIYRAIAGRITVCP